ncbi:MAG: SHOCT domain-containing protein [Lachnospiraceae bacterium]
MALYPTMKSRIETVNGELVVKTLIPAKVKLSDITRISITGGLGAEPGIVRVMGLKFAKILNFMPKDINLMLELLDEVKAHSPNAKTSAFIPTRGVGRVLQIDDNSKTVCFDVSVAQVYVPFSDIIGFEIREDETQIIGGGSAVNVGMGASLIGKRKVTKNVSSISIILMLKNQSSPTAKLFFMNGKPIPTKSPVYLSARKAADDTFAILTEITRTDESTVAKQSASALTAADEILKYKELADNGIITQDEFEQKKKQLLGL